MELDINCDKHEIRCHYYFEPMIDVEDLAKVSLPADLQIWLPKDIAPYLEKLKKVSLSQIQQREHQQAEFYKNYTDMPKPIQTTYESLVTILEHAVKYQCDLEVS